MRIVLKVFLRISVLALIFLTVNGCEGTGSPSQLAVPAHTEPETIRVATLVHPLVFQKRRNLESGFEHDLLEQFSKDQNHHIKWIPAHSETELLDLVRAGKADIASGRLSENQSADASLLRSAAFDEEKLNLVCRVDYKLELSSTGDLDLNNHMRLVSLAKLLNPDQVAVLQRTFPHINLTLVKTSRTSTLLKELRRKRSDCALIDAWEFEIYSAFFPDLKTQISFMESLNYHFYLNPERQGLQLELDRWFQKASRQGKISAIRDRYANPFRNLSEYERMHLFKALRTKFVTYSRFFKVSSREFALPWQLVAAVAYQESQWNRDAESFTGVRGLMQLTQQTAEHLGVSDRTDPAQSIWGGSKYLNYLIRTQPQSLPEGDRLAIALATYNVGPAHMIDAQNLAVRLGKNPYAWKDLKYILPLLADPSYISELRYGAARGQEPVDFVERVHAFYEILSLTI